MLWLAHIFSVYILYDMGGAASPPFLFAKCALPIPLRFGEKGALLGWRGLLPFCLCPNVYG